MRPAIVPAALAPFVLSSAAPARAATVTGSSHDATGAIHVARRQVRLRRG